MQGIPNEKEVWLGVVALIKFEHLISGVTDVSIGLDSAFPLGNFLDLK